MKEKNVSSSDFSRLHQAFSMLEIKRLVDDKEKFIFYIIPKKQEEKFLANPDLVDISLDAKEFYQVDSILYNTNPEKYNIEINNRFVDLVQIIGVISD